MQNIELKCELRDPDLAAPILRKIGAIRVATLQQRDTYFRVPDGRLKKRECPGEPTEWILYQRENLATPRLSRFTIFTEQEAAARFGARPLPVWVVVEKRRDLWVKRAVRVHVDDVAGLGQFLELETMVSPRRDAAVCQEDVAAVRQALGPALGEPISAGYADLLAKAPV